MNKYDKSSFTLLSRGNGLIRARYLDRMSDRIWSWRYNVANIWSLAIKFRELYHGFEIRNPRNAEERW